MSGIKLDSLSRYMGNRFYKSALGNTMGRTQAARAAQAEGKARLNLQELTLAIVTGTTLLYQKGMEITKPDGDPQFWKPLMLESMLGYAVLATTKGVYPLLAIGLSAYNAGKEVTKLEKAQAVVNTIVPMAMGYLGIHAIGGAFSEFWRSFEDQNIKAMLMNDKHMRSGLLEAGSSQEGKAEARAMERLNKAFGKQMPDDLLEGMSAKDKKKAVTQLQSELETQMKPRLGKMLPTEGEEAVKAMDRLQKELEKHHELLDKQAKHHRDEFRNQEKVVAECKEGLLKALDKVDDTMRSRLDDPSRAALKSLEAAVSKSGRGHIQIVRKLNPIFGYLIAGALLGTPVARVINRKLAEKFPQWQNQQMNSLYAPSLMPYGTTMHGPRNNPYQGPSLYMPDVGTGYLV